MTENLRKLALQNLFNREVTDEPESDIVSDYFGIKTFRIDKDLCQKIIEKTITENEISSLIGDIKKWAINNKATHYTHWFYPLRGSTAEKHDSFIDFKSGKVIENLGFDELLKQEPDASSFPSGGMRSTFESRGYSIWDPTSPLFIINNTLCISTIFVTFGGKTLDFKTPLIKSLKNLNESATKICQYFDSEITSVEGTLGWEQEFFVVDKSLYLARPDLVLSERTLFGHASAKDQQLSTNYFGSMPNRIRRFLKEVEIEAYKLGIPLKTRHNEVAPGQFEMAPIFEEINVAVDHNILLMNLLEGLSDKHNLKVLFHEKPFAGINGSGKHNNWSMRTNKGDNLLSPAGKTELEKLRFLVFLVNTVKGISKFPNLMRASIATYENEHRLGGHEAPPAIFSVFLGKQVTDILDELENTGEIKDNSKKNSISFPNIPDIFVDNTDRNRTSPFAFTGNKFEFRAPGSSVNCAKPMTILNLIVADQLIEFDNELQMELAKTSEFNKAFQFKIMKDILVRYIKESKYIRFEGDGYSDAWIKEAETRGLKNIKLTPDVLKIYLGDDVIDLYERNNILTKEELYSRYEIKLERYVKKVQIEGRVIADLVRNHILPAVINYQNVLLNNFNSDNMNRNVPQYIVGNIKEIDNRVSDLYKYVEDMVNERKIANKIEDIVSMAEHYSNFVFPYFEKIRYEVDKLELIVDDSLWPLPKYRELLFLL